MQGTKIASRYAKALIDLALEQGILDQVRNDVKYVLEVCKANKSLAIFLKSPVIKTDKKISIIKEVFDGKLCKTMDAYLQLITNKNREKFLVEIAEEFLNQYKIKNNILTAVVTTANGIDDITRKQIIDIVKGKGNNEVVLQEKLDKNIIGGIIVRVGDKQVDASVVRKLNNLKQSFSENPFNKGI
jgi:F-type H+-transporting ATPase subunit delta